MDIRCKTCSKLFRIADEKIAGKGIRFKCSQCGDVITVLKEDLERDKLARETAAETSAPRPEPQPVVPPAPPAAPPQQPEAAAASAPKSVFEEQETGTQQPPVSTGLDDFDFSAPHEAASGADRSAGSFETDPFADLKAEAGQGAGPEISISPEEEKAAEEAFAFPADIISEPARKSPFESAAAGKEPLSAVPPEGTSSDQVRGPQESPRPSFGEEPASQESRTAARAYAAPKAPARPEPEEDLDLGAALAIPGGSGADEAEEPLPRAASRRQTGIHPFASGSATGAIAGIVCGIPLALLVYFGFSMLVKFVPVLASLPIASLAAAAGAAIIGMGIIIGLVVAAIQAGAGRKLLFLVNILIGTVIGAGIGLGVHALISLAMGKGADGAALIARSAAWLVISFLLSIILVITRRIMVHSKEESFSEPMTGLQRTGLAISVLVILASVYAAGALTGSMEKMGQDAAQQLRLQMTPDGLTVVNAAGHIDPASGDLIIAGTVQNALDRKKPGWFLVVEVYDANQKVISQMKMLNGAQAFTRRDYEIMAKRGMKIDDLMQHFIAAAVRPQGGAIPAKGAVQFEMRLPEPPSNAASFLPTLKPFDPVIMLRELAADLKR